MEIVGVDERFTTFSANYDFLNIKNKNLRNDDISASLILETYLSNNKS
jgi:RNase H-fold protein (predicted Holliday junction resolvase)